jgi:flagellar hook protein FlgE
MMRSLFAAISGLRNHQLLMDTIGNNLANVNTTGYKASRMTFSDLLSQTISSGSAPNPTGLGGINSKQVGLGAQIGSIDIIQAQGSLQTTGKATDLAIQGDGFFVLSNGSKNSFTRDGAFDIASNGALVNPANGMKVQGWQAVNGVTDTTGATTDLLIPLGQSTIARETDNVALTGNLDTRAAAAATAQVGITVVDSLGTAHNVIVTFTKSATPGQWTYAASTTDTSITSAATAGGTITFDTNGQVSSVNADATTPFTDTLAVDYDAAVTTATDQTAANSIVLDFTGLTGLAAGSEVAMKSQDGFTSGTLVAFRLGSSGEVIGVYTNGSSQELGRLALANFANPGGLTRTGNNMFEESASSGAAIIGLPNSGGRGVATAGNLEGSNVDLSREFTSMITGQRGFQANARVITTSDEMLADLVNLRR